jgi:hypothetical protein
MPLERVIDPAVLSTNEKMAIFKQMKTIVPEIFGALSTTTSISPSFYPTLFNPFSFFLVRYLLSYASAQSRL